MPTNLAVFEQFPVLKTERLTLREIQLTDAEAIFGMRASGRVNRFIARQNMQDPEDALKLVEKTRKAFNMQMAIGWAGLYRAEQSIIGTCGFNAIDHDNMRAEIGGEMAVDYWGKHLALEAVAAIVQFGFEQLGLHSIEAKVDPGNRGAIALMEALGFQKEAHYKDRICFGNGFRDMAVYTLIKGNEQLKQ